MVRGVGADPTTPKERFYRPPSLPILCTLPYKIIYYFIGGGGEIRTHSAISNGFTVRPDSPTSALPQIFISKTHKKNAVERFAQQQNLRKDFYIPIILWLPIRGHNHILIYILGMTISLCEIPFITEVLANIVHCKITSIEHDFIFLSLKILRLFSAICVYYTTNFDICQ